MKKATSKKPKTDKSAFRERVLEIVASIPKGRVTTYGAVAAAAGHPRGAQAVGFILHYAEWPACPYQRVVNRFGSLAQGYTHGGLLGHKGHLEAEGIEVRSDFTVDLEKYFWMP